MTAPSLHRMVVTILVVVVSCMIAPLTRAQTAPFWPGPALSGSWFDSTRNGEGVTLQFLDNGKALVTWFTYPESGSTEEQAWLISDLGTVEGNKLKFPIIARPNGGRFGDAFNPATIVAEPWGSIEMEFRDCNNAVFRYTGPSAFGSGERNYTRLSNVDQLNCNGAKALTDTGARALAGLRTKSGLWYVPSRSGEGWMVEELTDGNVLVYWFTYTPSGQRAWTIGIGARNGDRVDIAQNIITRGTRFGSGFNPTNVQSINWGTLSFRFTSCDTAEVSYNSTQPGYGSGIRQAVRLASLGGATCIDGTPVVKTRGTWVEGPAVPAPAQSESASAVLDGKLYLIGGFGDTNGFKRFDPAANTWSVLPPLPSGRDHLAAFAIDGGVFVAGGSVHGDTNNAPAMMRFDVARNVWETRSEFQTFTFGSQATVLAGRAYIGSPDGSLQEYDPVQRAVRRIAAPNTRRRDHGQTLAYQGEIWVIGGRSPETTSVAIYDPVTERWRTGPSLNRFRGGFAAAVVDGQIVVAGGEVVNGGVRLEPSSEIFAPGSDAWRLGPDLSTPVHGVPGASLGGKFYVIGGSTIAGSESGAIARMFSIQLMP